MNILRMENITKRFPGVIANDHINLIIKKGEIHALLGENGAGKTTLMNILYGLYQPDEGEIFFKERKVVIKSPLDAMNLGIGMVHQHFMLVSAFTVLQNIILGLESEGEIFLDIEKEQQKILEISTQYGLKINPNAKIWQLSLGERQRVEIIKALYRKADLLVLDEPTAVLTPLEAKELFKILKSMKEEGRTIIFISHKLNEVLEISDHISVLRDGKVVETVNKAETDKKKLAKVMIGREIIFLHTEGVKKKKDVILQIQNLSALNDKNLVALKNVSFDLRKGEILGVAGVSGNGQRELAEVISGLRKATTGTIFLEDLNISHKNRKEKLNLGIGLIPEDRTHTGLIMDFTVAENMILEDHDKKPYADKYVLNKKVIESLSQRLVSEYSIKTPSIHHPTKLLSGGNLQKLLLARELTKKPRVLVANQPTRGLDVGATEYIHQILLEQRDSGTSIMLISEDLEEILTLSDRIMVMYEGKIMGLFPNKNIQLDQIGLMMTGAQEVKV